jgi:hypothetical protein
MASNPSPVLPRPVETVEVSDTAGPGTIRNIIQTVQEREIVKTAPDLVVMIDGASYLMNGYVLPQDGSTAPYALVHFNDHVVGFSAGYDTDQLVPQCSINLSVPNAQKYLYQTIGGNNLLKTMDELVVFAKGYWLSPNGNSLYHRVFKGVIKTVSHTDNGKTLDITITGAGILYFLQLMYLELAAPVQSTVPGGAEVMVTKYANLTPYEMIGATFREIDLQQGFQSPTANYNFSQDVDASGHIGVTNPNVSPWADAINAGYISKWQAILANLNKDVHVFGLQTPSGSPLVRIPPSTDLNQQVEAHTLINNVNAETAQVDDNIYLSKIREHLPEMAIGHVEMTNGRMSSRLDRLRYLIGMIGFEGYQDVNGAVIIKPPLFNLDCTQLYTTGETKITPPAGSSTFISSLTNSNNPFIIYLSEITNESEIEDEAGVVATRMIVQGSLEPSQAFKEIAGGVKPAGEFTDLAKLSRFGLREQPPKLCSWVQYDDTPLLFAVACWELQKANRAWRNYTCTIPLRPELKLGFPVFLPHKDMYGYVKSIQHSYQYGGTATTTITLDAIRKRPMYPAESVPQNSQNTDGATGPTTYYSSQPNLVHKMTTLAANLDQTLAQQLVTASILADAQAIQDCFMTGKPSSVNTVAKDNSHIVSLSDDQARLQAYKETQLRNWMGLPYDTPGQNYRVQMDPVFDKKRPADKSYLTLLTGVIGASSTAANSGGTAGGTPSRIPYTDSNGYEVIAPFPWGRYTGLCTALYECCQNCNVSSPQPDSGSVYTPGGVGTLNAAQSYLFSGIGTPPNSSAGDNMQSAVSSLAALVNDDSIFELTYTDATTAADQSTKQPNSLVLDLEASIDAKARLMVNGLPVNSNLVKTLSQIGSTTTQVTGSTISDDLKQLNTGFKNFTS